MNPEEIAQALGDLQRTDEGYRVEIDDAARRLHSVEDTVITINGRLADLTATDEKHATLYDSELDALDKRVDRAEDMIADVAEHDHEMHLDLPNLHFNGKLANVAFNALAFASTAIGALGASGQLDHLAIGGLVIGPVLIAFKRYIDSQTAVKTTAAIAAASAPKAGCPCS